MPIVNLTKLAVRLVDARGDVFKTIEPAEHSLKLRTKGEERHVDGVPIEITQVTAIEGLPDPQDGTCYIVPSQVAAVLNRPDLLVPDTGPSAIRDEEGQVVATRRLFSVTQGPA